MVKYTPVQNCKFECLKDEVQMEDAYLTIKELARYLKVKQSTVYNWVNSGHVPVSKVVGQWRFRRSEIEDWVKNGSKKEKKQISGQSLKSPGHLSFPESFIIPDTQKTGDSFEHKLFKKEAAKDTTGFPSLKERRLFTRIFAPFPIEVSPGIRGETVDLSETGLCLAMEKPIISSRTLSFKINFPFSQPFESHAELIWTENVARGERYLCGLQFLRLSDDKLSALREVMFKFKFLNQDFLALTKRLRFWLFNLKKRFDAFDAENVEKISQGQFVKTSKPQIFNELNRYFEQAWQIVKNFNKEEYLLHQKYYQSMLHNLLLEPIETNRYIYQRPLGYSGDYMIMNYFYDFYNKYLGNSSYQNLMNLYSCNIPIARSVVSRKDFFKGKILECLKEDGPIHILSVGSGPMRELIELLREEKITKALHFDCLDFDKKALDYVRKEIEKIEPEKRTHLRLKLINRDFRDFLDLLRVKDLGQEIGKYNFVYSGGVFDYLRDRTARRMIKVLCNLLQDGNSELIICNADKDIARHRVYYEMLGGWALNHRSKKEVLGWLKDLPEEWKNEFVELKEKNAFLFLSLKKANKEKRRE